MSGFDLGTFKARKRFFGSVSFFRNEGARQRVLAPPLDVCRHPTLPPRPPKIPRRLPPQPTRHDWRRLRRLTFLIFVIGGVVSGVAWLVRWSSAQDSAWDRYSQARADYERGDWRGAVAEANVELRLDPTDLKGYFLRACAYRKLDQNRLSAADERTQLELTPDDTAQERAVTYQNLAYDEDYAGEHRQAVQDFTEAIRLDPTIPDSPGWTADAHDDTEDSHKGRMWANFEMGQYALALQDCDALIARHPYPSSIAVRGKINRQMGNVAQAKAEFDEAISRDPHFLDAYAWEEEMLERHGQTRGALVLAEQEVTNNPGNVLALGSLGFTQYRVGQYIQAIATDKQVLARDPSQDWARFNLALAYAAVGDWAKARPFYAEAMRRSTVDDRRGALGDVREALRRHPDSAAMRQALALFPKDASAPATHEY